MVHDAIRERQRLYLYLYTEVDTAVSLPVFESTVCECPGSVTIYLSIYESSATCNLPTSDDGNAQEPSPINAVANARGSIVLCTV